MQKPTIFKFQLVMCKMLSIIFLSVCIIFSICVYYSFADVPCKINYQGRLIKDNVPVNIPVDMVFELYPSETETTAIWDETHNNVPVHNGLFRVVLDLSSIEQEEWTAGQELWLKVTVGGETLSPREPIYAYPYAINTHFLEGHTTAHFLDISGSPQTKQGDLNIMGNVGIGTTSPGRPLDVNGVVKTQAALLDPVNPNNINNPVDGMIACDSNDNTIKQYDESIADWKPVGGGFGVWTSSDSKAGILAKDNTYKVTSDGFIYAYNLGSNAKFYLYLGDTVDVDKVTLRYGTSRAENGQSSCSVAIPKNCYWKITVVSGTLQHITWLPIGSGSCVKQE